MEKLQAGVELSLAVFLIAQIAVVDDLQAGISINRRDVLIEFFG